MENNYKRTIAGSVGAGVGALLNADGRKFYHIDGIGYVKLKKLVK